MKIKSYEGLQDLNAMLDLLSKGCRADNGTHYVHRGDLQCWLFYTFTPQEVWQSNIRLWMEGDELVGWALLSKDEQAFDVFTDPHLRGSSCEAEMLDWAVENMADLEDFEIMWVAEDDKVRMELLESNGFTPKQEQVIHFKRSLSGPLNVPPLPQGFSIRSSRGSEDAWLRSICSYAAFRADKPFDEYWPRTLRFMQSPVYVPEHELFVVAPGGEIAAFCIIWTDALTRVGHFEPVGTHPDFQRKGLGSSLLFEAFRRLKSEGMYEADLCTTHTNLPAIGLYESLGFRKAKYLLTYKKQGGER
jgi:mycothiol synthase